MKEELILQARGLADQEWSVIESLKNKYNYVGSLEMAPSKLQQEVRPHSINFCFWSVVASSEPEDFETAWENREHVKRIFDRKVAKKAKKFLREEFEKFLAGELEL